MREGLGLLGEGDLQQKQKETEDWRCQGQKDTTQQNAKPKEREEWRRGHIPKKAKAIKPGNA